VAPLDPSLQALADAYNIATEYWDWQGHHVLVEERTIIGVLRGLGIEAGTPGQAWRALDELHRKPWRRMLPPFLALREHRTYELKVHVTHGDPVEIRIDLESGAVRHGLRQLENMEGPREIDGRWVGEASFELPADLPLGYHTVRAHSGGRDAAMPLVITPAWLGTPPRMGDRRGWGLATQLYSVRSEQSWGVGDLIDLTDLGVWSAAEHKADFILINPLHAAEPMPPIEPSPYLPTSRQFANPLYLRPERIFEYAVAPEDVRRQVQLLWRRTDPRSPTIDRDTTWSAKRAALDLIFRVPRTPGREASLTAYKRREGQALRDYATWCVLIEMYGPMETWPPGFETPSSPPVLAFVEDHALELEFHCWLQWLLDEQLSVAQAESLRAGMALGIMHDLAVGVHPRGADAWRLQDTYAKGITVGAPPDPYNQNGQDWTQPPWRPDALAESAYAPFREMVSTILRHAGGIRVDHVIGLFRLWWIPEGHGPTEGTYVRYDHEALVGILALEAYRAGALVVGEDLGTVEPWVREYLRDRGILGTSILWFEFEWDTGGGPLRPEWWREYCLASVTTHDLPPTAGYLAGDHVRLRDELGVLTRSLADELAADEGERRAWLDNLRLRWALAPDADLEETVKALHRYLTWTPSKLICVALTDAVGDRKIQNQPGTTNEYPNWRVPLSGPDGEVLLLEDVMISSRAAALAEVVAPIAAH
jgi:4-alpha-glucanotransferase